MAHAQSYISMRNPIPAHHLKKGQQDNFHIHQKRLSGHIFQIQLDLFWNGQLVPSIDLCPSRQAWQQTLHTGFRAQCNQVILIEQRRSRTDKTHIPFDDAPQLRQLIQAGFTQK